MLGAVTLCGPHFDLSIGFSSKHHQFINHNDRIGRRYTIKECEINIRFGTMVF